VIAAVGGLVVAVAMFGCGSGDDATGSGDGSTAASFPSAPSVVPRQKFIDDTHDLCKKWKIKINRGLKTIYAQREKETGEALGLVGTVESMRLVIVPSMKLELEEFEAVGLPKEEAYDAEVVWNSVRTIIHKIELEGITAWTRESLLFPYRKVAKKFELQNCLYF
jgi:hypothetical protein